MRHKSEGMARTGLWAAAILAAGALACGLGGRALAGTLPMAAQAEPLPVYTSLDLAAEDEPLPAVWRDYDPDELTDLAGNGLPADWYGLHEMLVCRTGLLWWDNGEDPLVPWQTLASAPGTAAYLIQYPLPDGATVVDASRNEVTACGAATLDVGLRADCVSVRVSFPDLPAATAEEFELTQTLAQQALLDLFRGRTDHFMGAQVVDGQAQDWLAERLLYSGEWELVAEAPEGTLEDSALAVCEAAGIDLQFIRLENELLVVLSDRSGGGLCGFYCDARLHSATGFIRQS